MNKNAIRFRINRFSVLIGERVTFKKIHQMKYLTLILVAVVTCVNGHVHLREPIARTSIQTRPEFGAQQPFWWDHYGVMCGNIQQNTAFSTCGRCGEAAGGRDASQGGRYDKGIVVATYTAGSVIK